MKINKVGIFMLFDFFDFFFYAYFSLSIIINDDCRIWN